MKQVRWKEIVTKIRRYRDVFLLLAILVILWQQCMIADLQERMMNIEASRYDEAINQVEWEALTALEENKEQDKDIYQLQKITNDDHFRIKEIEWTLFGKEK